MNVHGVQIPRGRAVSRVPGGSPDGPPLEFVGEHGLGVAPTVERYSVRLAEYPADDAEPHAGSSGEGLSRWLGRDRSVRCPPSLLFNGEGHHVVGDPAGRA